MPVLSLSFESGESSLSVRHFEIREALSTPFAITIRAGSPRPDIDSGSIVGRAASFDLASGMAHATGGEQGWTGICNYVERVHAVPSGKGESTYLLRIVPKLWLLSQRRNYRVFQHLSAPDIAVKLLSEWGVEHALRLPAERYPRLEYRVQYGETDLDFLSRILEEAGITYLFEEHEVKGSTLVLLDAPQSAASRGPIAYEDEPTEAAEKEFITSMRIAQGMAPGAATVRDYDFRRPSFPLLGSARVESSVEGRLEQYHYLPGAFLVEQPGLGDTPVADDKSVARHNVAFGEALASRLLSAQRVQKTRLTFRTNAMDLRPGTVFSVDNYPGGEIDDQRLLLADISIEGTPTTAWKVEATALFAGVPYVPTATTLKPRMYGVQSAVVVGPPEQEIHTDEFGRVRVQFPWDREGRGDDNSSCWVRVSHGSAGGSFGMVVLPRVGQEVLIAFVEGNPDQPIVVGRVFNATSPVPYALPGNKTVSGLKGSSSPGGGGYNELKFDDAAGSELLSMQAQKDMKKLVHNDDTAVIGNDHHVTVGNDLNRRVNNDETATIGSNRTKIVGNNEREVTGNTRTVSVGVNRSTQVGSIDSTIVGGTHVVTISPPGEMLPGGGGGGGGSTTTLMKDNMISLHTREEASIVLVGSTIRISAKNIVFHASNSFHVTSEATASLKAKFDLSLESEGTASFLAETEMNIASKTGEILMNAPMIKLNEPK